MSKQNQQVEGEGQAIQAGRDVTIGATTEQIRTILQEVASLDAFKREALAIAEARMAELRDEIARKFATPGEADPTALNDPDFQYMIGDAQEAFARSGDKNVKDVLLDIVARRSKSTTQTREAITLNSAARIATNLTLDEFSNLALVYVLRYTMRTVRNFNDFCTYFEATVMPLAKTATKEESSIRHIEANACGKNSLITRAGWRDLIIGNYGGVLGTGFDLEAAEERVGEERREYLRSTLIPSFHDPAKFQPKAQVKPHYLETFKDSGLQATELTAVWDLYATTMPEDATQMIARLSAQIPDIKLLNDVWEGLAGLELTNVGFAIGHAYATRAVNFNAPLNIWIK